MTKGMKMKRRDTLKAKLTESGFEVVASDGPALDRHARAQHDRWAEFIRKTSLKVEE